MDPLVAFCPAKLNLFLAVTGRRPDGFHDLVSLVVPLDFGDTLSAQLTSGRDITLSCDNPELPLDSGNLVIRAAAAFKQRTGWGAGVHFRLQKAIPVGAGLGGGSSNAAGALQLLNRLAGQPFDDAALSDLAAELGSDCPLFLKPGAVIIRGRGEQVAPLPEPGARRLAGQRMLLFKPAFGVSTPWAYGQLAAQAAAGPAERVYLPAAEAESRLASWQDSAQAPVTSLLYNTLELPVFAKYLAIPALLQKLERDFGFVGRMSGSGSCCFGCISDGDPVSAIQTTIRNAWGETAFQVVCQVKPRSNPS